jgi:ATP-dependent DNA helicase RecG
MITLNTHIKEMNRVGSTTAQRLKGLDIETVSDLLFYFPFRYDDFTRLTPIKDLKPGSQTTVSGTVELIQNKKSPRKKMNITEALVSDESGMLKVVWFNQPYIVKSVQPGDKISLAGKAENQYGQITMVSPVYEKADSQSIHTRGLVPNYHLTANITQKQIRFLVKQIIHLSDRVADWLPQAIRKKYSLMPMPEALQEIHFPSSREALDRARKRLAFNELFALQLESQWIKKELKSSRAEAVMFQEQATREFVASLPFSLTNDQKKAGWEIIQDMAKPEPMARLLEGDVGSGKTIVALLAMANTAWNGHQAALMVPTEILAAQHFASLSKLLTGQSFFLLLLTRSEKKIFNCADATTKELSKKEAAEAAKNPENRIIIGTHALVQEDIQFRDLVLAVIDEQHRFGVEQRKKLVKKSGISEKKQSGPSLPHLLSMTATPIPRSLALTLYGELDISLIREKPKNRQPIQTKVVPEPKRNQAYAFIRQQIQAGGQAYVICPLIDQSDKLGVKSVKQEYEKLKKQIFPDLETDMLHGRMKADDKDRIMRNFKAGRTHILVATSVIEVGVDIPNANLMLIEGADRFGLAQLHQFRGRVGRGSRQSFCLLFSENGSDKTTQRLKALEQTSDGFELAKMDLKMRGPGQFFGTEQKGFPELKVATIWDQELAQAAQNESHNLLKNDPELKKHPELYELAQGKSENIHLE